MGIVKAVVLRVPIVVRSGKVMFGFYLTQLLYAFATLCFMMRDPGFGALVQGFIVGLFSVFIVAMLERFFLPKRQVSRRPPRAISRL